MTKYTKVGFAALLLAGASGLAFANEPVDEILVVGSLTPISAAELGASVSVFDLDDLDLRRPIFMGDTLRRAAGLNVNQVGPTGAFTQVRIRGAESNHTLTLIDGIEVADPSLDNDYGINSLLQTGIERVTVLRGGQSSLYGSDALGGVVNFETIDPTGPTALRGEVEAGSFKTTQGGIAFRTHNDFVAVSVSASRFDSEGENSLSIGSEKDGKANTTLHGTLQFNLAPGLTAKFVGRKVSDRTDIDQDFAPTPSGDFKGYTDYEATYGLIGLRYESENGLVISAKSQVMSGATDFVGSAFALDGARQKHEGLISKNFGASGIDHTVTFAAQREVEKASNSLGASDKFRQTSYIAEYRGVTDFGISGSASFRMDDNKQFEDKNSWRVQGAYTPDAFPVRVHASAGTGIKAPTFFEVFGATFLTPGFPPFVVPGNADLTPESALSYDFGISADLLVLDAPVFVDATIFRADLQDRIFAAFFGAQAQNDTGKSRRQGLELTGNAVVADRFAIDAGFTWLDAQTVSGDRETYRPVHTGFADVSYAQPGQPLSASVGVVYNGDMRDFSGLVVEDYTLVNLSLGYAVSNNTDLTFRVTNLFDTDYSEAFGSDTSVSFQGTSRGIFVGLRASLGD